MEPPGDLGGAVGRRGWGQEGCGVLDKGPYRGLHTASVAVGLSASDGQLGLSFIVKMILGLVWW